MENNELKKSPFFAQLLEKQVENTEEVNGGESSATSVSKDTEIVQTLKYPSDQDEEVTFKYPSDKDEK